MVLDLSNRQKGIIASNNLWIVEFENYLRVILEKLQ